MADWLGWIGAAGGLFGGVAGVAAWFRAGTANRHAGNAVTEAQTANIFAKEAVTEAKASNVIAKESNALSEHANATSERIGQRQEDEWQLARLARVGIEPSGLTVDVLTASEYNPRMFMSYDVDTNRCIVQVPVRNEGRCAARSMEAQVTHGGQDLNGSVEDTILPDEVKDVWFEYADDSGGGDRTVPFEVKVTYRDDVGKHQVAARFMIDGKAMREWVGRSIPLPGADTAI